MALVCIAAAIIFAVKDALQEPDPCDDPINAGMCDDDDPLTTARLPGAFSVRVVVSAARTGQDGERALAVLAIARRFPRPERPARTL